MSLGVSAISKTSTYLLLKYLVDQILPSNRLFPALIYIALGFILLASLEGGATYLSGRLAAYSAEHAIRRLRNRIYDHLQRLPFTFYDQAKTGELIQRATSDVDAIYRFFQQQAIGLGRIIILFVINFIMIASLNSILAMVSIVVIPFIVIISFFFFKKISNVYETYQEQDAVLTTTLQENLTGVRVVKAFARQTFEIAKFDGVSWEKFTRGKKLLTYHALYWPFSDSLAGMQMLLAYLIGAWMAIDGKITVGSYLAFAGMVLWIIWPMRNLGQFIVQASSALVSYERVAKMMREKQEPLDDGQQSLEKEIMGKIEFRNVSFGYINHEPVLNNISFSCQPGEIIALLGAAGSGKTSLVNLLPRFYEYTGGSILLDNIELNNYSRKVLRENIGIVEQEPFLFSRTIEENIKYGVTRTVSQHEVEAAASVAAIHESILAFPEGYQTIVGEKGVTLSGGQKQRLVIARTLLKNPKILILDDATSSVDTETEVEIRTALTNLMQGRTVFIIAHRIQSVFNASKILVLEKGCVIEEGNHQELYHRDGVYRKIYDLQTRIETEIEKEVDIV